MKRKYKFMDIKLPFIALFIVMIAILTYNVSREILEGAPQKFGHTILEYIGMSYFLPIVVGIVLILAFYVNKHYSQGKTIFGYRPKSYDKQPEIKKMDLPVDKKFFIIITAIVILIPLIIFWPIIIFVIVPLGLYLYIHRSKGKMTKEKPKKKREYEKLIVIFVIIILFIVINYIGFFSIFNYPLNNIVAGEPDKSCNIDSDCVLRQTSCNSCDCGDIVNKNWEPFCPFKPVPVEFYCAMCPSIDASQIKCIENQCQIG